MDANARAGEQLWPLDVLKALGDDTRYAIYLELSRSVCPLGTAEIAETLGLHPNTVRPHLERLREAGLVDVEVSPRHTVGRPQHLYSLRFDAPVAALASGSPASVTTSAPPAPVAPGEGLPMLAELVVRLADKAGLGATAAVEVGHEQGADDAAAYRDAPSCLEALVDRLDQLGFDPQVRPCDRADPDDVSAVIAFARCPFQMLAGTYPHLVCSLHRGMVEGFVEAMGDAAVDEFHTLEQADPCQLILTSR